MVFQSYALYPRRTAYENIASPLRARRCSSSEIAAAVERVSGLLHIERLLQRRPAQLSGGEMQRVALARALVRRPASVPHGRAADEPRPQAPRRDAHRAHPHPPEPGRTFVYVTNDQVEALSMADQVAVLKEGKVQQVGTPTEVYERPANQWVAGFVGSPRISLLACHAEGDRLVGAEGWTLPRPRWTTAEDGRPLLLGLRAEDLSVERRGNASLPGKLYGLEPLGDRTRGRRPSGDGDPQGQGAAHRHRYAGTSGCTSRSTWTGRTCSTRAPGWRCPRPGGNRAGRRRHHAPARGDRASADRHR